MKQRMLYHRPRMQIVFISCLRMLSQSERTLEVESYEDYVDEHGETHSNTDLWANPWNAD